MTANRKSLPHYTQCIEPTLEAMRELGGGGEKKDIARLVAQKLELSPEQLNLKSPNGRGFVFSDWIMNSVRVALLRKGLIYSPRRGHWELTEKGWSTESVGISKMPAPRRSIDNPARHNTPEKRQPPPPSAQAAAISIEDFCSADHDWREVLLQILHELSPEHFERFLRRILIAGSAGQFEVISHDKTMLEGKWTTGGIISTRAWLHVYHSGDTITQAEVDKLRRATELNHAGYGLLFTLSSTITMEAERAIDNSRNPRLELWDGKRIGNYLRDQGLGLTRKIVPVETFTVAQDFFDNL